MKLVHAIAGVLAVAGFIPAIAFIAEATPLSGVAFTPVGRATVPAFDVNRRYRVANDGSGKPDKTWKIELEATAPIDVATQVVTFQPGGYSGWHTHPGPVFFTVRTGTLTVYEGDDPSCTPLTFSAGTGAVEASTSAHIHMVRNETSSIAEAVVTYLVPVGTPQSQLRTDLPDPGNCPF